MAKVGNYILDSDIVEEYDPADESVWPEFETQQFAEHLRADVIRMLKENNHKVGLGRWASGYDFAIEKLESCRRNAPCLSPICAVCFRRFRRWYMSHGLKAMEKYRHVYFVTWVPEPVFPPWPFAFDPANFNDMFQQRIARMMPADVTKRVNVWGYIEIKFEPKLRCLVPHIHCVMTMCTKDEIDLIAGKKWDKKRGRWVLPKDRIIHRPLVVTELTAENRVRVFSYCCKAYHKKAGGFPPYKPKKKVESQKKKKLREAAMKALAKHRKFKFTKGGYQKFLEASFRIKKDTSAEAEHAKLLAGLSVHDLPVLRRMTRKGIDRTGLNWSNAEDLRRRRRIGFQIA